MTHRADVARGRDVVARWCALAEQRLQHLTELFETGRWRLYHDELAFLENIREAKIAVEIWRQLSTREAQRDNSAADISWLDRAKAVLPRNDITCGPVHRFRPPPAKIPARPPPPDVPIMAETDHIFSSHAQSASHSDPSVIVPVPDKALELTLDTAVLAERYPLLRTVTM